MITIEFRICGFGVKHRFEFGDPRRSPITILELGIIKLCKFKCDSKFIDFMRGYCDNDEFEWHPRVRLARRKAERSAQEYYYKYYRGEVKDWINRYEKVCAEKNQAIQEKQALLKTIELKRGEE